MSDLLHTLEIKTISFISPADVSLSGNAYTDVRKINKSEQESERVRVT